MKIVSIQRKRCQGCWEWWTERANGFDLWWAWQEQLMNEWILLFSFNFVLVARLILSGIRRENTTILATTVCPFISTALGKRIRDKRRASEINNAVC